MIVLATFQMEVDSSNISTKSVALSMFYGFAILFGGTMNLLIIVAILSTKALRRRRANRFLTSLCFSDLLTCLFSISYHLLHLHRNIYQDFISLTYCRVTQYFVYVLAFSSTLCLTMVCIDRYLAILHPFFYVGESMNNISKFFLAWPWIHSLLTAIPALVINMIQVGSDYGFPCAAESSWSTIRYFCVIIPMNVVLPFLCIVITCLVVFKVARKQLHSIQTQVFLQSSSSPNDQSLATPTILRKDALNRDSGDVTSVEASPYTVSKCDHVKSKKTALKRRLRTVFREEARIAFATLAVVIGYFIAWTPYLISRLLYTLGQNLSNDVYLFGTVFVLSNSAWNPLLILLFRKDIRTSFKKTCNKIAARFETLR